MSSSLYESSSISSMLTRCREWPAGVDRPSLDERRRQIITDLESIIALPERINTEISVELIYNASRLLTLASNSNDFARLLRGALVSAAKQLSTSLSSEEARQRWLAYHSGGLSMIDDELVRICVLIRDATRIQGGQGDECSVSFCRSSSLCVARCLLPLIRQEGCLSSIAAIFPSGVLSYCAALVDECRRDLQYTKRGLLQTKSNQENMFLAKRTLQEETLKFIGAWLEASARCGGDGCDPWPGVLRCLDAVMNTITEPRHKGRDMTSLCCALQLARIILKMYPADTRSRMLDDIMQRLLAVTDSFVCPSKETLKENWMLQKSVVTLPLWDRSVCAAYWNLLLDLIATSAGDEEAVSFKTRSFSLLEALLANYDGPRGFSLRDALVDSLVALHPSWRDILSYHRTGVMEGVIRCLLGSSVQVAKDLDLIASSIALHIFLSNLEREVASPKISSSPLAISWRSVTSVACEICAIVRAATRLTVERDGEVSPVQQRAMMICLKQSLLVYACCLALDSCGGDDAHGIGGCRDFMEKIQEHRTLEKAVKSLRPHVVGRHQMEADDGIAQETALCVTSIWKFLSNQSNAPEAFLVSLNLLLS